ncbi:MAG: hypothetical protein U0795_04610 [Pirellulales bacterium]
MIRQQRTAGIAMLTPLSVVLVDVATDPIVPPRDEPGFASENERLPALPFPPLSDDGAGGQEANGRVVSSPNRLNPPAVEPSPAWSPFA